MDSKQAPITLRDLPEPVRQAREAIQRLGNFGSRETLDTLIERHGELEDLHALAVYVRLWTGDPEGAERQAEERLALAPSAAMFGMASAIAVFLDDMPAAKEILQHGVELDPDHFLVLRAQIDLASIAKDTAMALHLADRSLLLYPEDPDMFSIRLTTLQVGNRLDEAEAILADPPAWFLDTAQCYAKRGMFALARHDIRTFEAQMRLAVAASPGSGSYWGFLAMALANTLKLDEAAQAAQFAIEMNPRNVSALRVLAKVAEHRGYLKAQAEFNRRADTAIPALKDGAKNFRANALLKKGKVQAAIELHREVAHSENAFTARMARVSLLGLLITHGRWSEAREQLDEIEELDGTSELVRPSKIKLLRQEGKLQEALSEVDAGLAAPKPQPEIYGIAVELLCANGQQARAAALLDQLARELPGTPDCLANIVMSAEKLGLKVEARSLLRAAQRAYPESKALRYLEMGFAAEDGRVGYAVHLLRQMPPTERPKVFRLSMLFKPRFWRNFFQGFFRGRRGR